MTDKPLSLRERIAAVLRDHHEVKHIGALADKLEAVLPDPWPCDHVWGVVPDPGGVNRPAKAYCVYCGRSPEGVVVMTPRYWPPSDRPAAQSIAHQANPRFTHHVSDPGNSHGFSPFGGSAVTIDATLAAMPAKDIGALEAHLENLIAGYPAMAALATSYQDQRMWFVAKLASTASGRVSLSEIEELVKRHLSTARGDPSVN